jgi:hypothetical protein
MASRKFLAAALAAALLVAVSAAACGGDDDGDDDGTPAADTTPTVNAEVTPFPTPQIVDGVITDPAKGYSARIPEGWRAQLNVVQTRASSADVFIEPLQPGAEAQANIVVNCIIDKGGVSEDERFEAEKTTTAFFPLHRDLVEGSMQIAGRQALALTYTLQSQQNPEQPLVRKTDLHFDTEKCAYEVTLTAGVPQFDQYQDEFAAFLQSFQLID